MEQLHLNEAMYMSSAPAQTSPAKTCLDNAVDHRLRELFRPVSKDTANTAMGSHLSRILEAGLSFERCDGPVPIHEIGVTQELAWSGSVVGILVMLLQPANTQLFDMGLDVAIQECGTFAALDKAFRAVSRGSLNIHDITIVDSLPFLRPKDEVFPQIRMDLRMQAFEIVEAKRPDVILCMWQDNIGVTGNMTFMRSIGIAVLDHDLAHFISYLADSLKPMKEFIISHATDDTFLASDDKHAAMVVTEHCNDIILNLRGIWLQYGNHHLQDMSEEDESAISAAVMECTYFLRDIVSSIKGQASVRPNRNPNYCGLFYRTDMATLLVRPLRRGSVVGMIPEFLIDLNSSFSLKRGQRWEACLSELSELFLDFAVSLERQLEQVATKRKGNGNSRVTEAESNEAMAELTHGMTTATVTKPWV